MGKSATSACVLGGPLHKGTETKVAHKCAEVLNHPHVFGGPLQKKRETKVAKKRRKCYITPAFSGIPKKGDKVKGGPQLGGRTMSPLRSRESPNKRTKSKMAHKRAEVLPHPCVLGGPLQKETEIKVAHKWAEVLHHPSALTGPKTKGRS